MRRVRIGLVAGLLVAVATAGFSGTALASSDGTRGPVAAGHGCKGVISHQDKPGSSLQAQDGSDKPGASVQIQNGPGKPMPPNVAPPGAVPPPPDGKAVFGAKGGEPGALTIQVQGSCAPNKAELKKFVRCVRAHGVTVRTPHPGQIVIATKPGTQAEIDRALKACKGLVPGKPHREAPTLERKEGSGGAPELNVPKED